MLILTSISFLIPLKMKSRGFVVNSVQQSLVSKFISAFQVEHFLRKIRNFVFAVNIICLKDMTFLVAFPRAKIIQIKLQIWWITRKMVYRSVCAFKSAKGCISIWKLTNQLFTKWVLWCKHNDVAQFTCYLCFNPHFLRSLLRQSRSQSEKCSNWASPKSQLHLTAS